MEESRIFIEISKTSNSSVLFTIGGGFQNDGTMESYHSLDDALNDLSKRAISDYQRISKNKVCVSFKELYMENGAFLENGGYIDFYGDDDGNEYYDLRTDDVDKCDSKLIACDGEEFEIISENENMIILKNVNSEKLVYLSTDEKEIAIFK